MFQARTILHPTDFSAGARLAFDVACSLAQQQGAKVVLLYVAAPVSGGLNLLPDEAGARKVIDEKLAALQQSCPAVSMSQQIRHGEPAEEIVLTAHEHKADLIVMGTQGRTGLTRLLVGSVAETVLRTAPCPVLAVRAPQATT